MNITTMMSCRYIKSQKRHTALTIACIITAVALISTVFTIFSTFRACMLNAAVINDPWHAQIFDLTEEEAKIVADSADFAKTEYGYDEIDEVNVLYVMFEKDIDDCDYAVIDALNKVGKNLGRNLGSGYSLNTTLLNLEVIGVDAKAEFSQTVAMLYIFILFIVFCARFVIDTAFEISSKERERQFGLLQSVGASKKQITSILLREGLMLSAVGMPIGLALGIVIAYVIYKAVIASGIIESYFFEDAEKIAQFSINPLFIGITAVTGVGWVLLSAYGTGVRAAKMSPIEAIKPQRKLIKKVKKSKLSSLVFGWQGTLAARNVRRNKMRFIVTVLSLTLSMTLFTSFSYVISTAASYIDKEFEKASFDFLVGDFESDFSEKDGFVYESFENDLKSSGYFENIMQELSITIYLPQEFLSDEFLEHHFYDSLENGLPSMVYFVSEDKYNYVFKDDAPISYDELYQSDGFVLLNTINDGDSSYKISDITAPTMIDVDSAYIRHLDEPIIEIDEFGNEIKKSTVVEKNNIDFNIAAFSELSSGLFWELGFSDIVFIGTVEQYKEKYCNYSESHKTPLLIMDLKDEDRYTEAIKYIEKLGLSIAIDNYGDNLRTTKTIAAVKILGNALIALISLIAAVNMFNIISTGIINRRAELASLRAIGMSGKQQTRLIVIESLQYVLVSGVVSLILSELIMLGFASSIDIFEIGFGNATPQKVVSYTKMLPRLGISVIAAFVIGTATSLAVLSEINKTPLTESMRAID